MTLAPAEWLRITNTYSIHKELGSMVNCAVVPTALKASRSCKANLV